MKNEEHLPDSEAPQLIQGHRDRGNNLQNFLPPHKVLGHSVP